MGVIKTTSSAIGKRPFILFFFSAVTLVLFTVNNYNPLIALLFSFQGNSAGQIFESIIAFIQLAFNADIIIRSLPLLIIGIILATLLASILLSGYLNVLFNALAGRPKSRGEFGDGIRAYFLRTFRISVTVFILIVAGIAFMLVASVPAMVVTRAVISAKTGIAAPAVFLDVLTVACLWLGFVTLRAYLFFWYPAVFAFEKRPFTMGKHVVDARFWSVVGKFIVFDIWFIIIQGLTLLLRNLPVFDSSSAYEFGVFVFGWILKTGFFLSFAVYIFSFFIEYGTSSNVRGIKRN